MSKSNKSNKSKRKATGFLHKNRHYTARAVRCLQVFTLAIALIASALIFQTEVMADMNIEQNQHVLLFHASPGLFPSGGGLEIRTPAAGTLFNDFPPDPVLEGHDFIGWVDEDGAGVDGPFVVNSEIEFTAMFSPSSGSDGGTSTTPSPSPDPGATATPSPTPGATATPSPTPTGGSGSGTDNRHNPQNSAITISFVIFIAVFAAGFTANWIIKLAKRQYADEWKYQKDITRHDREKRLLDLFKKDKK